MRGIITFLITFLIAASGFCQEHKFSGYGGVYCFQTDYVVNSSKELERDRYGGAVLDFEHEIVGLRFVGSHGSVSFDHKNKFGFTFGIAFRFHFYNDLLRVEVLPPMYYQRSTGGWERPFGIGVRIGKDKLQINIRELIRNGYLTSQITVRYRIF